MCLSPLTIKNPYYNLGDKGLNCLHNTHDSYIQVPCGNCSQCVSMRQMWFTQRVQMESLRSHLFMLTLTYQDSALRYINIGEYNLAYPDYSDVQNMLKRLRVGGLKFRYWFVSEYGTKSFRPHFHAIIALDKSIYNDFPINLESMLKKLFMSEWKRKVSKSKKYAKYLPLCKFVVRGKNSTFDLHYIEPIKDHDNDCSFYISKYVSKYDSRLNKLLMKIKLDPSLSCEQTSEMISKLKPRSIMSKDFGDFRYKPIHDYIIDCVQRNDKLPQFYDINTGRSSLLSPYYRKHLMPFDWYVKRFVKYSIDPYSFMCVDDTSIYEYNVKSQLALDLQNKWDNVKKVLESQYLY